MRATRLSRASLTNRRSSVGACRDSDTRKGPSINGPFLLMMAMGVMAQGGLGVDADLNQVLVRVEEVDRL